MKQVVLRAYPADKPKPDDFRIEQAPDPVPAAGEVLLETLWLSLDPLIRFALDEKTLTGVTRVALGEPLYGGAVSRVLESGHADFQAGDFVEGRSGWRERAAIDPAKVPLRKLDPSLAPLNTALGVLGMPGQTAHACMVGVGRVKAGETVVISAAAGAVGSVAGQIGKMLGARVIGIAGGPQKCEALRALGFDAAVDYKAPDYRQQLTAAVGGKGIDVYVENVSGDVTQAVLPLLKYGARMPMCGFIAYYGVGLEGPGPDRLPGFMRTIMSKGLEVRGFGGAMVGGRAALEDMAKWLATGAIRYPVSVVEGLEQAPQAFCDTFGGNTHVGKVLVRVAPE